MTTYQQQIIDTIGKGEPFITTPRDLFRSFGFERRTKLNRDAVDQFLEENELNVVPHYSSVWVDENITILQKEKATRRSLEDPIKKLRLLPCANNTPKYVSNSSTLNEAITVLMMNNYSQLPITQNALRNTIGYLSWRTIGEAQANGITSDSVKDYVSHDFVLLNKDTPLLDAINIVYDKGFVFVENEKKELCGIVTTKDISSQFLMWTKPFLLMEEIENQIRSIIDGKLLLDEVKELCKNDDGREIHNLDDLNFGEYVRILQTPKYWKKIDFKSIEQKTFIAELDKVREIRNDIMHFDPQGLTEEQTGTLLNMAAYLKKISSQF